MTVKTLKSIWLLGSALLLTTQNANATLTSVGANDGQNGFPVSYGDANEIQLAPCLDPNEANCLPLEGIDATQPVSFPNNFPPEFFWWIAESDIALTGGGDCLARMALGGTFTHGAPEAGARVAFNRTRFRCNLSQPGTYRITWPFGTRDFVVSAVGAGFEILDLIEHGLATPENFETALGGQNGPFLRWDPAVAPAAPEGYVGNPGIPHSVIGSTLVDAGGKLQNYLRVERLDSRTGTRVELGFTDQFWISGKLASGVTPGDTTPPTVTAPAHNIAGTSITPSTTSVIVSWTGNDDVGVASYTLEKSANSGPFVAVVLSSPTATSFTTLHNFNTRYQYRVRAQDVAGNVSANASGLTFNPTLYQQFNGISYTSGWASFTSPGAIDGTLRVTTSSLAGHAATTTFGGNSAAWIQSKMATRGIGEVLVNGVSQGTRDLYSAADVPKNIAFIASNLGRGTHSLRIRSTGTKNAASSGTGVDVDGFLVLRTIP